MNITVVCVGKIKEDYLKAAINEYLKRLSKYCKLNIIEVEDEKAPENISAKEMEQIKQKEANRIAAHIKPKDYVIALDLKGTTLSSEDLAQKIQALSINGQSNLVFLIGGSLGFSTEILKSADFLFSFSKLTFPHQLIRVFLLEQIFRSFKIIKGETYHK
jgi:23S rRNA (pseudouridine1915-N3)-methyltransferase